jgi:hypothetical protein
MKRRSDRTPFSVDPSWYEEYWYEDVPAKPSRWAALLLWIAAFLRGPPLRHRVSIGLWARRHEAAPKDWMNL